MNKTIFWQFFTLSKLNRPKGAQKSENPKISFLDRKWLWRFPLIPYANWIFIKNTNTIRLCDTTGSKLNNFEHSWSPKGSLRNVNMFPS